MHHSLQIIFILPLMTGHLFWKATILGGLYRGVPLYLFFPWPSTKFPDFPWQVEDMYCEGDDMEACQFDKLSHIGFALGYQLVAWQHQVIT